MKILNNLLSKGLAAILAFSPFIAGCGGGNEESDNDSGPNNPSAYSVEQLNVDGGKEYRFKTDNHHFMSLIEKNGAFTLRPHPGEDVNGWGSSLYFQPFLPGAVLKHTTIESLESDNAGIRIRASGKVSRGENSTYGGWNAEFNISYDHNAKKVSGTGNYSINLENLLNNSTGDLNLYKLASNYLDDVPLLSGGVGDTGDMTKVVVQGEGFNLEWIPENEPAYFPGNRTSSLSVDVIGDYNEVDTARQGYERIEPAQKPGFKVSLNSPTQIPMIFGAMYTVSESQNFWSDNVGITPLIVKDSTIKDYNFNVTFESTP